MALIDDVLPDFDVHEVHAIACARSLDEALATPVAADPLVRAVDEAARRAFRRYWLLVGPFSALIRRRWLKRIAA